MSVPMRKIENTTTYVKPVAKTEPVQLNVFRKPELTIEQRIDVLTKYESPDPLMGVTKIYFLEVHGSDHDGYVKVGDTHRAVVERNSETVMNAALIPKSPAVWYIAEKFDTSTFRDKAFHKFLEDKGYKRKLNHKGTKSEWFLITLEDAIKELELFCQKPIFVSVEPRNAQNYLMEQEQKAIDSGVKYINADYCMRSGKTILSLLIAKNNNWMPVYLGKNLTSQNSADQDNNEYGIVPCMTTESLHGPDGKEITDAEFKTKVNKIIENVDSENKLNQNLAFYVDEADDGSHTIKSCAIIKAVVDHFKKTGQFAFFKSMTGTRSHLGMKIINKVEDGPIKEISLAYWEMQILQPETTCKRNYRNISFYRKDASGFTNISDAFKNGNHGHKSLAIAIAGLLDSANNYNLYENADYPHWFMKFATGGDVKGTIKLVKYLNKVYKTIEGVEYHFHAINSTTTSNREAEADCKKVIEDNPGKVVVFITQGMATTSFSVTSIGNSVVFSDNPLRADDVQALHRAATWTKGKVECNMIRVTTNASNEFDWDSPFEDDLAAYKGRDSKKRLNRQMLKQNSMIHFKMGNGFEEYYEIDYDNVEDVIDKKMKSLSTNTSMVMMAVDTFGEDMLNEIYYSELKSKPTNKKSGTDKGDKIDPFGKGDDDTPPNTRSKEMGASAKEKKLKAFVEAVRNVPAQAREQETTMEEFDCWEDIDITKEFFFRVYNTSPTFQDQIDSIFNLCEDDTYLIDTFLDKLV